MTTKNPVRAMYLLRISFAGEKQRLSTHNSGLSVRALQPATSLYNAWQGSPAASLASMPRPNSVLTAAAAVLVAVICSASACETPFEVVGNGCFNIVNALVTWWEARLYCQTLGVGVDLAVVDDCYLMQELWSRAPWGNYWIGGTDQYEEGVWEWVDGTKISMGMPFWTPDNINGSNGGAEENCLDMDADLHGYFNDAPCGDAYNFICQDSS